MARTQQGSIGRLSLVGTPIGNLEDITLRALKVLAEADVLYCEDTRRSRVLLSQCKVERTGPVKSYHDHSPRKIIEEIRQELQTGAHIAYITDGGMPGVADPGYALAELARSIGATVSVIPGPTAVTAFFAAAGLPTPKFLFHGFFPRSRGEVEKVLEQVKTLPLAHIFYESPTRLMATLDVFERNDATATIVVGREITKIYEEFLTGTAEKLREILEARDEKLRGEIVFGVMGGSSAVAAPIEKTSTIDKTKNLAPWEPDAPAASVELNPAQHEELVAALKSGLGSKDVAKEFSKRFGISRRALYDYIVRRLT